MDEEKENRENEKNKKMKRMNTILFIILFIVSYIIIFLIGKIKVNLLMDVNNNKVSEDNNNTIYEQNIIANSNNINQNNIYQVQGNKINNSLITGNFNNENNNDNSMNNSTNNNTSNNNDNIIENPDSDIIKVWENGKQWSQKANLNIFSNSYFNNHNIIAPGIRGRYNFEIENSSNKKIIYFIRFKEENDKEINLKYRLKKNSKYVLGNDNEWIYIDNKTTENYSLVGKAKEGYTLEWYWEDSDRDTQIGQDENVNYKINIEINSAIVEE